MFVAESILGSFFKGSRDASQFLGSFISALITEFKMLDDSRCSAVLESPWSHKPGMIVLFRDERMATRFIRQQREAAGEKEDVDIEDRGSQIWLVPRRLNAITISACRVRKTSSGQEIFIDSGLIANRESREYLLSRRKNKS